MQQTLWVLHQDKDISPKMYLLYIDCLERTNHSTIIRAFVDSMQLLGPDYEKSKVILYVTDAAPYMVKSGKTLKVWTFSVMQIAQYT